MSLRVRQSEKKRGNVEQKGMRQRDWADGDLRARGNNPRYLTRGAGQQHWGNTCSRCGAGGEAEERPCPGGEQQCNWKNIILRGTMTRDSGQIARYRALSAQLHLGPAAAVERRKGRGWREV